MLSFLDPIVNIDEPVTGWAEVGDRPLFACQLSGPAVNGHDVATRHGGAFSLSARTVCGLRGWDDAREGVEDGQPFVFFEIEKLVRMALHQSGVAFELLASSRVTGAFAARDVLAAATTRDIVAYYRDVGRSLVTNPDLVGETWRWRALLTGLQLRRSGEVSLHLPSLLAATDALGSDAPGTPAARAALPALVAELDDFGEALPAVPPDYAFLDDLVASCRLESP